MMKLALAIICSFVLAGTPFLLAQTPLPACGAKPLVSSCCQNNVNMPCCQSKPESNPQPTPAVPVQTANQNQLSLLVPYAVTWVLPEATIPQFPSASPISFVTKASPLYARNCSRLI